MKVLRHQNKDGQTTQEVTKGKETVDEYLYKGGPKTGQGQRGEERVVES